MELNTRNITIDEFRSWSGIDLESQLKGDDNPSNAAQAFIDRETYRLESFIDAEFYRSIAKEYPNMQDYQKEHYKHALLEQILYVFKMGDISIDSGYDAEKGVIASNSALDEKTISRNVRRELILAGVWNGNVRKCS